jgi:hypothetical protein
VKARSEEEIRDLIEEGWGPRFGLLSSLPARPDMKLTRFRGAGQAFNGGFSDAQDASALFT